MQLRGTTRRRHRTRLLAAAGAFAVVAATIGPTALAAPAKPSQAPPPGGSSGQPPTVGFGVSPTPTRPPMSAAPAAPGTTPAAPPAARPKANQLAPNVAASTTQIAPYSRNLSNTQECISGGMSDATDYARLWFNRSAFWRGGDLGASTRLSDGRVLWMLGDNMDGAVDSFWRWGRKYSPGSLWAFNRNGVAVQSGLCLRFLLGYPGWIASTDMQSDSVGLYWPYSVVELPGHKLVALLGRFAKGQGSGLASYLFQGTDLAVLDWNSLAPTAIYRTGLARAWETARMGPDGMVHLFGSWIPPGKNAFDGPSVYVARANPAVLTDPAQWQFWNGAAWVTGQETDQGAIVNGGGGWPSAWIEGNQWHVAYKAYEGLGSQLVEQATSNMDATSGWSKLGALTIPNPPGWADDHPGWTYSVLVEPDVNVGGGHLVFWSTNQMAAPGYDTTELPYLVGPEFVAWQPGHAPHWATAGPAFAPGFDPVRVALLPGRVLALAGMSRSLSQNIYSATLGLPGSPPLARVVADAMSGPSAQTYAAPVVRLYDALFLRAPDLAGYNYWVGAAVGGMSMESIANQFATSTEFNNRYHDPSNVAFIQQLYQNVFQRPADPGGLLFWVNQLVGGMTRGEVVLQFSNSPEYRARFGPKASIELAYFVLLGRGPDPGGLAFWLGQLQHGVPLEAVVASVMNTPEFLAKMYPSGS